MRRLFLSIFILATSVQAAPEGSNDLQGGAAAINPALLKLGHQQFIVCSACHGQAGEGTGAGPPLAGSEWVSGPVENLIRIQLRGLQGPIKVKGVEYNFPAGMAALAYQTDEQIAAVLTYVRNSHGNSASAVSKAEVAAFRGEVGKPALTVADLISPFPATADPMKAISNKYDGLPARNSSNLWMIVLLVAAVAIIAFFIFKKKST